jgi:tRNA1(Val) A37 N6-methylase TrmN6
LAQPKAGYRANVDALWLAAFAARSWPPPKRASRLLDLGAGVGTVGLALLFGDAASNATLIDLDPDLVELARRNADDAGFGASVEAAVLDLRSDLPASFRGQFDLVVANPPFHLAPPSPDPAKARARTAEPTTLRGFARAARAALGRAGRACFVHPAAEIERLFAHLAEVGLEPKRMQLVHPFPDAPASVALVEGKPGRPGGLRVEPPLVAMRAPGLWTDEASRVLEGRLR